MRTTSAVKDDADADDKDDDDIYYKYMHLSALNSWCPFGNGGFKHSQLWLALFLIIPRYNPFGSQVSKSMGDTN